MTHIFLLPSAKLPLKYSKEVEKQQRAGNGPTEFGNENQMNDK
jgi:hypothetical protein